MAMWQLSSKVYLDSTNKCYKKIIAINTMPTGPLATIIKAIPNKKLSPFKSESACCPQNHCLLAVCNPQDHTQLLCLKNIASLFSFLSINGYTIQYELTKIMQHSTEQVDNLICYIS